MFAVSVVFGVSVGFGDDMMVLVLSTDCIHKQTPSLISCFLVIYLISLSDYGNVVYIESLMNHNILNIK